MSKSKGSKVVDCQEQRTSSTLGWKLTRYEPNRELVGVTKRRNSFRAYTTKAALIERLIHVWFHSEKIKNHGRNMIKSMPRRVEAVIKAKVGHTKY